MVFCSIPSRIPRGTLSRVVVVLLIPAVLALGAHFLRAGNFILVGVVLLLCALLAVPRRWVATLVQGALGLGTIEWLRTLVSLAHERAEAGEPTRRMAIILAAVAFGTAVAAILFYAPPLRRFYRRSRRRALTGD